MNTQMFGAGCSLALCAVLGAPVLAQTNGTAPKSVAHNAESGMDAGQFTRTVEFDTDEGTYMCVDVSPDGTTLVFDLLGDLYTMPIGGGRAKPLLSGRDWVKCPRYSPDGKAIAFISDRGNINNLWTLAVGSRTLRQLTDLPVTAETGVGVNGTPIWSPNGREIAYLVGNSSEQRIAATPATGGAARVLAGKAQLGLFSSPAFAPDGEAIFVSDIHSDVTDPTSATYLPMRKLYRLSLASGVTRPVAPVEGRPNALGGVWAFGGDIKPVLSRSGRYLAYIHSNEPSVGELRVRDLESGADRRLMALPDVADVWAEGQMIVEDGYPGYAITPDEKDVVIWSRGKLYRVALSDGATRLIPFTVHVTREVAQPIRAQYRIPDTDLQARSIRWPTLTADGQTLMFAALGSLWRMSLPRGRPERLTQSDDFELMPALSPDGTQLAYIVCAKAEGGHIRPGRLMIRRLDTGETPAVAAPADSAGYWLPSWSPDGTKIAVLREVNAYEARYGWIDLPSGQFHQIAPATALGSDGHQYVTHQHIVFSRDGTELLYVDVEGALHRRVLRSARLDGSGTRELLTTDADITAIYPSPDLSSAVLLGWDYEAYLTALPKVGEPARRGSIFDAEKKAELIQISEGGALYPRWLGDGTLVYGWTTAMFQYRVGEAGSSRVGRVDLTVPRRGNKDVYAWRNARVITMSGEQGAGNVIDKGTIVVRGPRIVAVGPVESTAIPPGATIIEASGLTIMPGLIDAHAHFIDLRPFGIPIGDGVISHGLTYGFTTAWDAASTRGDDTGLSAIELLESGRLRGVRWFSSVGIMNLLDLDAPESGVHYRNAAEVRGQVHRRVELGAEQCVKHKNSGQYRQVLQWIAEAAREAGVCAVSHVSNATHMLARVADGYQVDHPLLWAPSYHDVVEFLARTGTVWTMHHYMTDAHSSRPDFSDTQLELASMFERLGTTDRERAFRIRWGGVPPEGWWMGGIPTKDILPLASTRSSRLARLATELVAAGGKVAGASVDGGQEFDNHFELWAFRQAGMSPGDVLRTGTMVPAEKLGLLSDIGSLEVGKLADMVVLTDNPLEQIENTLKIKYTVLAGMIYDRETLEVLSPRELSSPSGEHPAQTSAQDSTPWFMRNNAAWTVFQGSNNQDSLRAAVAVMKDVVREVANDKDKGNLSVVTDTYANLLYKVGRVDEAIQWQEEAVAGATEFSRKPDAAGVAEFAPALQGFRQNLDKMKAGTPTWPQ